MTQPQIDVEGKGIMKSFRIPLELLRRMEAKAKSDRRNLHNYVLLLLEDNHPKETLNKPKK